jgi:hypothetical protein
MGECLDEVFEDAEEGCLMLQSTIRVAWKLGVEKYMVDGEGETWDVGSCDRVPLGDGKRARRAFHGQRKVGGREATGKKLVAGA